MNTELLRKDETYGECAPEMMALLRQRLSEEREKNADLNRELNSLSDEIVRLHAELAEARKYIEELEEYRQPGWTLKRKLLAPAADRV